MRILNAILITLLPAIIGLAAYYWTVYPFTLSELATVIGPQLWYTSFYWLCLSVGTNYWMLTKLHKARNKSGKFFVIKQDKNGMKLDITQEP